MTNRLRRLDPDADVGNLGEAENTRAMVEALRADVKVLRDVFGSGDFRWVQVERAEDSDIERLEGEW